VSNVFFVYVFYTKVVDNECEGEWARLMSPESWGDGDWRISVWFKELDQSVAGNLTGLG
jgi:hypothetical protein